MRRWLRFPSVRCATLAAVILSSGCGSSDPAPTVSPTPVFRVLFQEIHVYVNDGLERAVSGATVKVVGGSSDGVFDVTDDSGLAVLKGPFEDVPMTFRADKDDATVTTTMRLLPWYGRPDPYALAMTVILKVRSAAPAPLDTGAYTATFEMPADSCPTLPAGLRRRSYAATLTAKEWGYDIDLTGGDFLLYGRKPGGQFQLLVAGRDVGVFDDGFGGQIQERVAPHAYWNLAAIGSVRVDEPNPPGISIPFGALLRYCEVEAGRTIDIACRVQGTPIGPVRYEECPYSGVLTLTRR